MTEPLWLSVARAFEGLTEIPGPASNPVIMRWAADLHAPYTNDDEAWCALWLNRLCLACQLPRSGTGYALIRARSFEMWGRGIIEPALGAVCVFTRPGGGHVGLYLGERGDAYYVLGGNTANKVGATWIAKGRLTAMRWPFEVSYNMAYAPKPFILSDAGTPVSTDEA